MSRLEVVNSGLVYRNAKPHVTSRHAYFPSLIVLPSGEWIVTMDIGSAFESVDARSYICRSSDEGANWTEPKLMFEPDESAHPISTTCRTSRLPDGRLVGWVCLFDRSRVDEGLSNPATDGFVRTQPALVHSDNDGHDWSAPVPVNPAMDWQYFETCSPVVAITADRWLVPTSFWSDWEGNCPHGAHVAAAFLSEDGGRSWPNVVRVMDESASRRTAWEQKLVTLSDGRLMCICWCFDFSSRQSVRNRYAFSTDGGESFGPSIESPLNGETCTPVALPDNHVACVYRRTDKRGLWAHLSRMDGDTWHPLADANLWGSTVEGRKSAKDSVLGSLGTLRFGYPSVQRLSDDEIVAVFWCVEECVFNIRWFRIRIQN